MYFERAFHCSLPEVLISRLARVISPTCRAWDLKHLRREDGGHKIIFRDDRKLTTSYLTISGGKSSDMFQKPTSTTDCGDHNLGNPLPIPMFIYQFPNVKRSPAYMPGGHGEHPLGWRHPI